MSSICSCIGTLCPQLVTLTREIIEILGGRVSLDKVCHWGQDLGNAFLHFQFTFCSQYMEGDKISQLCAPYPLCDHASSS